MIGRKRHDVRILFKLLSMILILALMLGAFSVFATEVPEAGAAEGDAVRAVRLVQNVPKGTRLNERYVETVTLQKTDNIPDNIISDETKAFMKYMRTDGFSGEYLTVDMLSEQPVAQDNGDVLVKEIAADSSDYLVITDYIKPDTGENLSAFLQELIDLNPNRSIYFPEGEYLISAPLLTSAAGANSVSMLLADGAVIKASDDWRSVDGNNALICLGGAEHANNIKAVGSYYTLMGGTLDGNGKAYGVVISSGRESVIRNICIKNTKIGIHIPRGANNTSSDCDFEDITIIGDGRPGTVGIDVIGADNTFTNIRIYDMALGMKCGGGEHKSIYVVNTEKSKDNAQNTVGFQNGSPRMTECFTENCAVGFNMAANAVLNECTSVWTSAAWTKQVMFNKPSGQVMISGCRAFFLPGAGITTAFIRDTVNSGSVYLEGCIFDIESAVEDNTEKYLGTPIIDPIS